MMELLINEAKKMLCYLSMFNCKYSKINFCNPKINVSQCSSVVIFTRDEKDQQKKDSNFFFFCLHTTKTTHSFLYFIFFLFYLFFASFGNFIFSLFLLLLRRKAFLFLSPTNNTQSGSGSK